jgi:hypothetical protein
LLAVAALLLLLLLLPLVVMVRWSLMVVGLVLGHHYPSLS